MPATAEKVVFNKAAAMKHWHELLETDPAKTITPIPYKHEGSTYAEDGIRVTGSREFVESVMSQMKSLLQHENQSTRIQIIFGETVDRETQKPTGSYAAYIQVHQRGGR